MVRGETMGIFASLLILSVVGPALSQWKVANPWGHGPLRMVGGRQPPPQPPRHVPRPPPRHVPRPPVARRPHPPQGMPTHWNRPPQPMPRPQPVHHHRPAPAHPHHRPHYPQAHRPAAHGHAARGHGAHGAHAPSTAATPIEKEPLEIEGPTTTPRPAAYPSYNYHGAHSYGGHAHAPAPAHHGAHAHPPPQRWPARPPPPRRPPPVHPPRQPTYPHPSGGYHGPPQQPAGGHHHGGYPQPAARPPPQRPAYRPPPPQARPQPGAGYHHQQHHSPGGHGHRPMGAGHGHAHAAHSLSRDPLSKYDVFSTNFDINTFHDAVQRHTYQETTPDVLSALGGGGGTGTNDFSLTGWAQSLASSFGLPAVTTTPRPPPTTTPNHKVHVNPYRHGGLFLADPNKKPQKKPSTQIIEVKKMDLGNGITHNPMMGWLGNTPPPAAKETTPLPGKNGDIFSGFMGFHSSDQGTTPSSKQASNQIQNKFQTFFAPVPVTNNNQNNPWGPGGQGPGGTNAAGGGGGGAMSGVLAGKMDQIKQTLCREMGLLCH